MKTKPRNKAEQARFDKMKEAGICMACHQRVGMHWQHIEIHHLLSGNKRIGHMATVSLCPWHHRGVYQSGHGHDKDSMTQSLGASLANGSKPFRAEFGSDAELLAMQNEMLGEVNAQIC